MICPRCQFDNPHEASFCMKCGTKLENVCSRCGRGNPPGGNFCMKCGEDLRQAQLATPLDYAQPRSYTPRHLADKILAARSSLEGERKLVTVLFADVADYTAIAEKLGLEEVHRIMDGCFRLLVDEIHRFEGTIDKFAGDGVMALFGAPVAHEDHAQRACYASLGIQRAMSEYGRKVESEHGVAFKMRIGINSGPVIVGSVGYDLRMDYFALGDTTNLASRVQKIAEPGTILATEETQRLAGGYFEFKPLGEVHVKGREQSVKAYRLLGPGLASTRLDVSQMRGLTPFVGRQRELELLMDAFERAKAGRGQAISVIGEAGVGKSRLVHEFRKTLRSEDITCVEGRCLSYSSGVAYHPFIDMLKSGFGIAEGEEERQIRDDVSRGLKEWGVNDPGVVPYTLELLSVKNSGIDDIPVSPESRRDRITEALKRIVLQSSELRPLVLAIEDLHWIDKASEESLRHLLASIAGARVLIIFTYRPGFTPPWGSRSYHSQVTLNRLSNRESLTMLARLLGTDQMDREFEDMILEKTEGIPFFIEEFVRSLRDLGLIEMKNGAYCLSEGKRGVVVPGTIQDVIMARVDPLPEGAKMVLRIGSVIEREFSYLLLKRVTGLPEHDLLSHLSALRDAELLYERGIYPQSTYVFKHALTREVVYDLILTAKKKRLHVEVADAIEEIYRKNLSEHYEMLAEHYAAGGKHDKAVDYWKLAEVKAVRTGSYDSAIAHCRKRIASLEQMEKTKESERKLVNARIGLGLHYGTINYLIKARDAVQPLVGLVSESGDKKRLAQVYNILGAYSYGIEEDFDAASRYLNDALRISEEIHDPASQRFAHAYLGWASHLDCQLEKALHHFQRLLEIGEAVNDKLSVSLAKSAIAGLVYCPLGRLEDADRTSSEALKLADESLDTYSRATANLSRGYAYYCRGFLPEAEMYLLKSSEYSERMDLNPWYPYAYLWLGQVRFDMQDYRKAAHYHSQALAIFERGHFAPWLGVARVALARARVRNGDSEIDTGLVLQWARKNRARFYDSEIAALVADIMLTLRIGEDPEADSWMSKAIQADEKSGRLFLLGRDHALYADMLRRAGRKREAEDSLRKAVEVFEACQAGGWAKIHKEALGKSQGY
ncbi:MAG: adenylate/guanylate cyclase domain-containing protein [Dehalococcoidia bacterium]|nr:adenylate/guanylate cyclase domain-containing protein [Dehalococcoidia bacterium]